MDPLRPFEFLAFAEQFYDAFRELRPRSRLSSLSWPRYFMLCHAIELSLKAFLSAHGATTEQLRTEFGHDLTKLLSDAIAKGLILPVSAKEHIELLNEAHTRFWHRYPKEDGKPVFIIEQFEPSARELFDQVSEAVLGPNIIR
jgi:HEPN domain